MLLCIAIAAPERPAIRLWLSLVGIPTLAAATLYTTIENNAAHSPISASCVFSPKSTMLLIVEATELFIWVIIRTPRKLKTALVIMADLTPMLRVPMHVAMALGASVHPFTKITPSVRATVTIMTGLEVTSCMK